MKGKRKIRAVTQKTMIRQSKARRKKRRKIKESDIDTVFSLWIRNRDKQCVFPLRNKDDFHSNQLQCSHFYGRTNQSVRFDPENCDTFCSRHHQFLEGRKNQEYYDWKLAQMGLERFRSLKARCYQHLRYSGYTEAEKQALLEKWKKL